MSVPPTPSTPRAPPPSSQSQNGCLYRVLTRNLTYINGDHVYIKSRAIFTLYRVLHRLHRLSLRFFLISKLVMVAQRLVIPSNVEVTSTVFSLVAHARASRLPLSTRTHTPTFPLSFPYPASCCRTLGPPRLVGRRL